MNKLTIFVVYAFLLCPIPLVCLTNTHIGNVRLMFPTSDHGYFEIQTVEDNIVQRFALLSRLRENDPECLIDVYMRQKTFDALLHFDASQEHTIDQLCELAQAANYLQDRNDAVYRKLAAKLSIASEEIRRRLLQEAPYAEKLVHYL